MGDRCRVPLAALSVLLVCSASGVNSGDSCLPCPENSICHNSTYCVCKSGFQETWRGPFNPYVKCEDINECSTGRAKCKDISYCKNRIGSYVCSCVIKHTLFSWLAKIFVIDQPGCYESKSEKTRPEEDFWENRRRGKTKLDFARDATQLLQKVELSIWNESSGVPRRGEDSALNIVYETKWCDERTLLEAGNNSMDIACAAALRGASADRRAVALITHRTLGNFLNVSFFSSGPGMMGVTLNSRVVSGTVGSKDKVSLSAPVRLTFQHTQGLAKLLRLASNLPSSCLSLPSTVNGLFVALENKGGPQSPRGGCPTLEALGGRSPAPERQPACVYREGSEDGGSWSTAGCSHLGSDDSHTACQCSHLSSFAVLMALAPQEDPVLAAVTYAGLSVSLLCLFLAALTFLRVRPIQNTATTLHLQLALCLFLAHFLFLTGINRTKPETLCAAIAGALHYLYLAAFTWMLLEGLHLFLTVRNLKVANYTSTGRFRRRLMYPVGYGLPALIVALSATVGHKNYGTFTQYPEYYILSERFWRSDGREEEELENFSKMGGRFQELEKGTDRCCWLKLDKGFIWSFMGPVAFIVLINLVFFFQTLWILRSKLSSLNKEVSTIQDTRVMTFKAVAQLFVLGCSWALGFFLVEGIGKTVGTVIAYLFTIVNVLQGVLLFVVHCLLNRQVRMEYKNWFGGVRKDIETESMEMSRSTAHTKMEEPGKSQEFVSWTDTKSF